MKQDNMRYKVSKYCRLIKSNIGNAGLVYHSLFGNGLLISVELVDLLNEQHEKIFIPSDLGIPGETKSSLAARNILIPQNFDEENVYKRKADEMTSSSIAHLRLCLSESCNLQCKYCYVPLKKKAVNMPFEIAEKAIKEFYKILNTAQHEGDVTFFGGEPLLNREVLKKTTLLALEIDPKRKYFKNISVVTNGTLIDRKMAAFFKKTQTNISISLDGPKEVHDKIRKRNNGEGSYDDVIRGINVMASMRYKPAAFICTIGDHNVDSLDKVISFADRKKVFLHINTAYAEDNRLVYRTSECRLFEKLVEAEQLISKHETAIDAAWRWPYIKLFTGNQNLRHCMSIGRELTIDCEGNIKPCPGFEETYGNIFDIKKTLSSQTYRKFSSRTVFSLKDCQGCEIQGLCAGGCMLNSYKVHKGNIFRKSDSCSLFKRMFRFLVQRYLEEVSKNI